jgi:hypothetical protein
LDAPTKSLDSPCLLWLVEIGLPVIRLQNWPRIQLRLAAIFATLMET